MIMTVTESTICPSLSSAFPLRYHVQCSTQDCFVLKMRDQGWQSGSVRSQSVSGSDTSTLPGAGDAGSHLSLLSNPFVGSETQFSVHRWFLKWKGEARTQHYCWIPQVPLCSHSQFRNPQHSSAETFPIRLALSRQDGVSPSLPRWSLGPFLLALPHKRPLP